MIAAGTYRVSSSDLAAKLLQVMQEQRSGQGRWMQT
jgi:anti-sigma28 factor (negative regulator of flagellin synthesis)